MALHIAWVIKIMDEEGVELQTRQEKAFKLYLNILEQLIKDEYSKNGQAYLPTLLMDLNFLKAVAGLALEVRLTITQIESFIRDDQNSDFQKILTVCTLNAYDVWRVLIGFAKLCSDMPMLMKMHLCFLEMHSFFELFWLESSPLVDLIRSQATSSVIDHRREMKLEKSLNSANEKENQKPDDIEQSEGKSAISLSQNVKN